MINVLVRVPHGNGAYQDVHAVSRVPAPGEYLRVLQCGLAVYLEVCGVIHIADADPSNKVVAEVICIMDDEYLTGPSVKDTLSPR